MLNVQDVKNMLGSALKRIETELRVLNEYKEENSDPEVSKIMQSLIDLKENEIKNITNILKNG